MNKLQTFFKNTCNYLQYVIIWYCKLDYTIRRCIVMERKVYLWGDSIGKGVVYQPERGRYCLARRRCCRLLQAEGLLLEEHTRMGATALDGYEDFCQTAVEPGSVAVIEFGGNDCDLDWHAVAEAPETFHDGRLPLPAFREVLTTFVRSARQRGLLPLLVTPPPLHARRYFAWIARKEDPRRLLHYLGDVEHIYRWQERYAQAVREIAAQECCPLADLREVFLEQRDFPDLICQDGIHPTEAGQELMARAIRYALPAYQQQLGA